MEKWELKCRSSPFIIYVLVGVKYWKSHICRYVIIIQNRIIIIINRIIQSVFWITYKPSTLIRLLVFEDPIIFDSCLKQSNAIDNRFIEIFKINIIVSTCTIVTCNYE